MQCSFSESKFYFVQNQQLAPPPNFSQGRRKQPLIQQRKAKDGEQPEAETIDAERLEDVLVDENPEESRLEEALKDVSVKRRK